MEIETATSDSAIADAATIEVASPAGNRSRKISLSPEISNKSASNKATTLDTPSADKETLEGTDLTETKEAEAETKEIALKKPATLCDVYQALIHLPTPGATCLGGVASGLPTAPGLTVPSIGTVPLPITEMTANTLKAVAAAPASKEAWRIDAEQVSLQHPSWNKQLEKIVHAAASAFALVPEMVQAHLDQLVLFEKGRVYQKKPTKEGMFATLLIQLPSVFQGGAVVVSHHGKKQRFKLDDAAPFLCHSVAYYDDCEHDILPLTFGYRLALVYSLSYQGPEMPSAHAFDQARAAIHCRPKIPFLQFHWISNTRKRR